MNLFGISDLHLSADNTKPMVIFGENWHNHANRIYENWHKSVSPGDVVLIPGDISWAMHLAAARADFDFLSELPGHKVILRGNHDYWWSSLSRVRAFVGSDFTVIQNNAARFGRVVVGGSRLWTTPLACDYTAEDMKIYQRELIRLRLSLQAAKGLQAPGDCLVAITHYPPVVNALSTQFSDLLEEFGVELAVYGHLHARAHAWAFEGMLNTVQYRLISCDYINFTPVLLKENI